VCGGGGYKLVEQIRARLFSGEKELV